MLPVKYFTNIEAVKNGAIGRLLYQQDPTNSFEGYKRQLRSDEHLYMMLTGGFYDLMVLVDSESEYGQFYGQYDCGMYVRYALYALPADVVAK